MVHIESTIQNYSFNPQLVGPVGEGLGSPAKSHVSRITSIVHLFALGGPPDISRLIVLVATDTIDRVFFRRSRAYGLQEFFERGKAKLDSFSTVMRVVCRLGVAASAFSSAVNRVLFFIPVRQLSITMPRRGEIGEIELRHIISLTDSVSRLRAVLIAPALGRLYFTTDKIAGVLKRVGDILAGVALGAVLK